jgi:membrane protease YdiL (CAAX protease family)
MSSGYLVPAERPLILRIADFPLVALAIAVMLFLFANTLGLVVGKYLPAMGESGAAIAQAFITATLVLLAYKLGIAHLGEEPRDDLRISGALPQIGLGLLLGTLVFAAVVAVAAALGVYKATGWSGSSAVIPILLGSAVTPALVEEMLFRGILFRWFEEFAGTWAALIVSSALFGLVHITNPGATWFSTFCIFVEGGLLLGGAYMLTRSLWMPIGLHAAWNFTQGAIFSVPVSGHAAKGLLRGHLQGPPLLSGGRFGLEASLIALVIAASAGAWLVLLAIRRGALVPPWWVRRRLPASL